MRNTKAMLALTLVAGLGLTACGGDDSKGAASGGKTLKIGVIVPQSGTFAPEGQEVKRGYELALEKAGGKAGGRTVQLVFGDAFTPEDALAETDRLATREKVDMFVGTYATPASLAASDAAARHKLTFIETHAITDSLTTRGLTNYFRVGARAVDFAESSAKFVIDGLAAKLGKKVFVEHEDGPYGTSVAATQLAALKAGGLTAIEGKHKVAATDVTDSVLAAKRENPDIWLITGYAADGSLLLRTAAAQNFHPKATILVGAGDTKALYEAVGAKDLTDTFVLAYTSPKVNPTYAPGNADFYSSYRSKFNAEPLGTVANTGFNGMTAALKMLDASQGDTSPEAVAKAASTINIPLGGQPNGWGVKIDENRQNTLIRLLAVQWREDGTVPAVWPAEAAVDGEQMHLPTS
jgi:branched-chain amino acid transport system substrate-binding protein